MEGLLHPVRAVVHASPLTTLTVAGLSVVGRTVLTLASAGVRTITVVCENLAPEALATAQAEVARRLGYSSEFQLSRSFKRFEGVSPTAYLKSITTKERP